MPVLAIGDITIPYEIRRSRRARRMRITVRPGGVTVVAPWLVRRKTIETLVDSKRAWIERKTRALRQRGMAPLPERFVDGSRIVFRDRRLRLNVEAAGVPEPTLRFANAFHARVPDSLDEDERERCVRSLVTDWLTKRALADARAWSSNHGDSLGLLPSRIRIGNQKTLWGSCSARGTISLNWRLVAAPRAVFEYVVVHELCHLAERNHGPAFWALVRSLLPDYKERRAWLKDNGISLG